MRKRLTRGTLCLLLFFLLAPMEDGCKYEGARANTVQKISHPALVPLAKGK